jgi:hypothetical protein
MQRIRAVLDLLSKLFAKFYEVLPSSFRITFFNASSVLLTVVSGLALGDLKTFVETVQDPYKAALGVFAIAIFSGVINEIQKKIADHGTKLLAAERNQGTLNVLSRQINDKQKLIKGKA